MIERRERFCDGSEHQSTVVERVRGRLRGAWTPWGMMTLAKGVGEGGRGQKGLRSALRPRPPRLSLRRPGLRRPVPRRAHRLHARSEEGPLECLSRGARPQPGPAPATRMPLDGASSPRRGRRPLPREVPRGDARHAHVRLAQRRGLVVRDGGYFASRTVSTSTRRRSAPEEALLPSVNRYTRPALGSTVVCSVARSTEGICIVLAPQGDLVGAERAQGSGARRGHRQGAGELPSTRLRGQRQEGRKALAATKSTILGLLTRSLVHLQQKGYQRRPSSSNFSLLTSVLPTGPRSRDPDGAELDASQPRLLGDCPTEIGHTQSKFPIRPARLESEKRD